MTKLDELIAVSHQLRAPGGCPWDAEQTHESLIQYLTEETYELIEALETKDRDGVLEELGDVLYQVIFHSDLASTGTLGEPFNLEDVAERMTAKMVGRHPHVFGTPEEIAEHNAQTGDDVVAKWDDFKKKEKPERESVLDGVPVNMPALALASKVIGKAEKIGLLETDGPSAIPVDSEEDLGVLLLAIVSSARATGLDAERALRGAVRDLMADVRKAEVLAASDAGIIAEGDAD